MNENSLTAVNENSLTAVNEIIGFDLGHGQTSVARVGMASETHPTILRLFGRKNQVTAIAKLEDCTLIGWDALERRGVSELDVSFKRRPTDDERDRELIGEYVKVVHDHLTASGQVGRSGSYHYFVGCPSGWKQGVEVSAYEALLKESGIMALTVIKESHAALVHAKESDQLTLDDLKGPILVIDIGSSTTDFTFSKDRRSESRSDGYDLGGGMIDQALLAELLTRQDQRAEIEARLGQDRLNQQRCLVKCRQAKEAYFANPASFQRDPRDESFPYEDSLKLQKVRFEIELDADLMEKVLASPLPELDGRTWEQAFREAAARVKQDWIDPQQVKTGVILATGGASGMPFVQKACADLFPDWRFKLGTEPEHAISSGLARWGRVEVLTHSFEEEISGLLDVEIPKLVKEALPQLLDALVKEYTNEIVSRVIRQGLYDWRNGKVKALNGLEGHMKKLARSWAASPAVLAILKKAVDEWLKPLQDKLYEAGKPICKRSNLPPSVLRLGNVKYKPNTRNPDLPAIGDPTTIADVVGAIVLIVIAGIVAVTIASATVTAGMGAVAIGIAIVAAGGVENWARTGDVPGWFRKQVLSVEKITQITRENRPVVGKQVRAGLEKDQEFKEQFSKGIVADLRENLKERIEEARLLIK